MMRTLGGTPLVTVALEKRRMVAILRRMCYFWRRCRKGWATQATQQQKVETSLALSDLSDSIRIMEGQQALSPQKPPLKQAQLSPKKGKRERKPPGRKGSRYSALEEP